MCKHGHVQLLLTHHCPNEHKGTKYHTPNAPFRHCKTIFSPLSACLSLNVRARDWSLPIEIRDCQCHWRKMTGQALVPTGSGPSDAQPPSSASRFKTMDSLSEGDKRALMTKSGPLLRGRKYSTAVRNDVTPEFVLDHSQMGKNWTC